MRVRLNHKKLAEIIARSPLSQNRLAQKLSLSRGHLSDLINGRHVYPSPRTRHKILQGLGVEFDELFTLEMPRERSITREADSALLFSPPGVNRQGNAMIFILWEIRKALRGLTRQPLFAVTVFSTLALGLGLNATVFTLINGMLLEPLPFPGAERIVVLTRPGDSEADVSILDGRDLREGVAALESLPSSSPSGSTIWWGTANPSCFLELRSRRIISRFWESSRWRGGFPAWKNIGQVARPWR